MAVDSDAIALARTVAIRGGGWLMLLLTGKIKSRKNRRDAKRGSTLAATLKAVADKHIERPLERRGEAD